MRQMGFFRHRRSPIIAHPPLAYDELWVGYQVPEMTAGRHFVNLGNKDIEKLASSVYYYKITNSNNSIAKKMLILK
jgi:hypothetical protein